MPQLTQHYHVGIVVDDLQAARARLAANLGVVWGPVLRLDEVPYLDGAGSELTLPSTICYSTGDPCLELIEEVPGTVWVRNDYSNLHHIGYWSDDLSGDSGALGAAGCPLQLCGRGEPGAISQFAYHRDEALGIRIEVVDAGMRELMGFLFTVDPDGP